MRWGIVLGTLAVAVVGIAVQSMTRCSDWVVIIPSWVLYGAVFLYWRAVAKVQL